MISDLERLSGFMTGLLLAGLFVEAPVSQTAWQKQAFVERRVAPAGAFDSARNRIVRFGSVSQYDCAETWEWDGSAWIWREPKHSPSPRLYHAMAYDPIRQRVVMFGGRTPSSSDPVDQDTWEWDGDDWIMRQLAIQPPAMERHAMIWDPLSQRILMYGAGEGWAWDGNNWERVLSGLEPGVASGHAMAYDPIRQRIVMFGGVDVDGMAAKMHTWNGSSWELQTPMHSPSIQVNHRMAWDPTIGRILMLGLDSTRTSGTTWAWDGSDWIELAPTNHPGIRQNALLVTDTVKGEVILFGGHYVTGFQPGTFYQDTWRWDGSNWHLESLHETPLVGMAASYDSLRDRLLIIDASYNNNLWELKDGAFTELFPANRPPGRESISMVYDSARDRLVMFGGYSYPSRSDDTWEWDGNDWQQRFPAHSPPPLSDYAMVYDSVRQRVVLFGGKNDDRRDVNDTWEWDGSDWIHRRPLNRPPAISSHAMAFDSHRGVTVLFGGGVVSYSDLTWEWDGNDWTLRFPGNQPPRMRDQSLVYDAARRRTVLSGGVLWAPGKNLDTWEWDGEIWIKRGRETLSGGLMVYDSNKQQVIAYRGDCGTWIYGAVEPARVGSFGAGCAGTIGVPLLGVEKGDLPWVGEVVRLRLTNIPPGTGNLPIGLIGFSKTQSTLGPLPLPLDALGMPGCSLYVSLNRSFTLTNLNGSATWEVQVPSNTSLVGSEFYLQGGVLDPGANALNLVLSNATQLTAGSK